MARNEVNVRGGGGADVIFSCVILLNIKNDPKINSSVIKKNKLFLISLCYQYGPYVYVTA